MALDFPNAPITGATFPGPNGALWQWDGEKWTAVSTSSTGGGGGASIVMQPSPPALAANALWWDTIGGQLYVCYDDGVGPLQWVTAANIPGPPASQVTQIDVASAQRNVGRNLIHNALFTVAQRGVGPFTLNGVYSLDRWLVNLVTDTVTISQVGLVDADRAAIGDEEANAALQNTFTGNAAAGALNYLAQKIENVRRLANKTIILSFWAKAASGTPKIGLNMTQNFGTGGSPSANVLVLATGNSVTLSTAWTRYSTTITLPSIAGKTLGTASDSTWVELWFSSGATLAARSGNIGVQSGIVQLWGVQLEIAAPGQVAPTPLEKMDAQQTLAVCQRFYVVGQLVAAGSVTAGHGFTAQYSLPVDMRGPKTLVITDSSFSVNLTGITMNSSNARDLYGYAQAIATAATTMNIRFTASADL